MSRSTSPRANLIGLPASITSASSQLLGPLPAPRRQVLQHRLPLPRRHSPHRCGRLRRRRNRLFEHRRIRQRNPRRHLAAELVRDREVGVRLLRPIRQIIGIFLLKHRDVALVAACHATSNCG